jgi:hypothetical protein
VLKKITYINSALAICATIIGIILTVIENPEASSSSESWVMVSLLAVTFVVLVAGATQLIGRMVRKVAETRWVFRLGVVVSAIWFLLCVILIEPLAYDSTFGGGYYNIPVFLASGVVPLVVFWGLVWVAKAMFISGQGGGG